MQRFIRTLGVQLTTFVEQHQREWDWHIPFFGWLIEQAVIESTKCTPAPFMFGHERRTTENFLYGVPEEEQKDLNHVDYLETLQSKTEKACSFAGENVIASDKMEKLCVGRSNRETFKRGDLVWFNNPRWKKG